MGTSLPAPTVEMGAFGSAPIASLRTMVSFPALPLTLMMAVLVAVAYGLAMSMLPPLMRMRPALSRLDAMVLAWASPTTAQDAGGGVERGAGSCGDDAVGEGFKGGLEPSFWTRARGSRHGVAPSKW